MAQQLDIQMKPEQLKEFYETFECNTDLLKEKNRKVSLHKLCRYIDRESERYPIGEKNTCMWNYSYNRYKKTKAIEALSKMHIEHQKIDGGNKGNDVVRMWAEKVLQNRRDSDG